MVKVLTTARWEAYLKMFAERGMEVYEVTGMVLAELETSGKGPGNSEFPCASAPRTYGAVTAKNLHCTRSNGSDALGGNYSVCTVGRMGG